MINQLHADYKEKWLEPTWVKERIVANRNGPTKIHTKTITA